VVGQRERITIINDMESPQRGVVVFIFTESMKSLSDSCSQILEVETTSQSLRVFTYRF